MATKTSKLPIIPAISDSTILQVVDVAPTVPITSQTTVGDIKSYITAAAVPAAGTCTLSAGTSTVVSTTLVTVSSKIFLQATNSSAAALAGEYISAISAGISFTITHPSAAGTETFNYVIIG